MKSVLISIQPKWCELIASGKKTVEVRKTKPLIPAPFKAYIYETKDAHYENLGFCWEKGKCFVHAVGKVIGEFTCSSIKTFSVPYPAHFDSMGYCATRLLVDAQLTKSQAHRYLKEKTGYAWHISDLVIYDKPRELREFCTLDNEAIKKCENREQTYYSFTDTGYIKNGMYCSDKDDWCVKCKRKTLTRPPQSWCYVEEVSDR